MTYLLFNAIAVFILNDAKHLIQQTPALVPCHAYLMINWEFCFFFFVNGGGSSPT